MASGTVRIPVEITWPGAGSPGANIWHGRYDDDASPVGGALQNMVDAIRSFYVELATNTGTGFPILAAGSTYRLGQVVNLTNTEYEDVDWTQIVVGGSTGLAPLPLAACVTWRTSKANRRGRGRTFLGPLGNDTLEANGTPGPSVKAKIDTAAAALVGASLTTGNGWGVGVYGLADSVAYPAPTGEAARGLPRVLRDITGHNFRDQYAVLRSRRD